ncbi:hypothetical protein MSG28_012762 [Choristoneura fumiferana]|uniref:Uncharacterized protein n=1 Tax=Choristoneura fumiferana TaxID=7141 RepID=A0ACC0JHV6_CHOFU|nr:hypothetical protein MSG28_012762 [Choristoneura fumiferana]
MSCMSLDIMQSGSPNRSSNVSINRSGEVALISRAETASFAGPRRHFLSLQRFSLWLKWHTSVDSSYAFLKASHSSGSPENSEYNINGVRRFSNGVRGPGDELSVGLQQDGATTWLRSRDRGGCGKHKTDRRIARIQTLSSDSPRASDGTANNISVSVPISDIGPDNVKERAVSPLIIETRKRSDKVQYSKLNQMCPTAGQRPPPMSSTLPFLGRSLTSCEERRPDRPAIDAWVCHAAEVHFVFLQVNSLRMGRSSKRKEDVNDTMATKARDAENDVLYVTTHSLTNYHFYISRIAMLLVKKGPDVPQTGTYTRSQFLQVNSLRMGRSSKRKEDVNDTMATKARDAENDVLYVTTHSLTNYHFYISRIAMLLVKKGPDGITLDSKLQWGPHVTAIAGRLSSAAFAVWKIRQLTDVATARLITLTNDH